MAVGCDIAWALAALDLAIPVIAAVPFDGQECRWPEKARLMHAEILARARKVHIVSPGPYAPDKYDRRNEWMVDQATKVVALWSGAAGGTANCVAYAGRTGKPVENLWPKWKAPAP